MSRNLDSVSHFRTGWEGVVSVDLIGEEKL
jgi:hypothetical protein